MSIYDRIRYFLGRFVKKIQLSSVINSKFGIDSRYESECQIVNSSFGRHTYCGYNCTILNTNIGSFCSLANFINIGGASHPIDFLSTSPVFLSHKDAVKAKYANHDHNPVITTSIGNDVWIGNNVTIKAGVSIGNGAIIGMGSVVTKDVPNFAIVGGNPAKLIRYRFDEKTCKAILKLQWWNFSEDELRKIGRDVNDVQFIIENFRK